MNKSKIGYFLFWLGIYFYFVLTSNMEIIATYKQVFVSSGILVCMQLLTALLFFKILRPRFLENDRLLSFSILLIISLFIVFCIYCMIKYYYYDVVFYDYFSEESRKYADFSLGERIFHFQTMASKFIKFITPTALLYVAQLYQSQKNILALKEQKQAAELNALKRQLNPHFLFNTLNNLYALAITKSDQTPEVIEKLSDILDYMIYKCNDRFVSLDDEITLIKNYIALEKIRYGNRVQIDFDISCNKHKQIPPLILLSFVENAFTHGVSEELNNAKISISISCDSKYLNFKIENTLPSEIEKVKSKQGGIGLKNVKEQLDLIFPSNYTLLTEREESTFKLTLKLKNDEL